MTIDPTRYYYATLKLARVISISNSSLPCTHHGQQLCLSGAQGLLQYTTFYQVIPGFMVEAGDPTAQVGAAPLRVCRRVHPGRAFYRVGYWHGQ